MQIDPKMHIHKDVNCLTKLEHAAISIMTAKLSNSAYNDEKVDVCRESINEAVDLFEMLYEYKDLKMEAKELEELNDD